MPSGVLKNLIITVLYPIDELPADWTRAKIEKWIVIQGGVHESKLSDRTTHVVCSKKAWSEKVSSIQKSLEFKAKGHKLWILSPSWLEDVLRESRKVREGPYSWEKLDEVATGGAPRKKREQAEDGGPRTTSGLMTQLFQESADPFVVEAEKKRVEKQKEADAKIAREMAEAEEREMEAKKREAKAAEAVFRKGAKKARNEIFSDNHHVYTDTTGFAYDIHLTKVDTKKNRNERLVLTIYESNPLPPTYATNLHSAGTAKIPSNNVIAAIGCNFLTAMHAFKKVFEEKTRVHWDERVSFAIARAKREKRARGQATGSPEGTQRGQPVSEDGLSSVAAEELPFAKRSFEYHPPLYGPRGVLPDKLKELFPEIGPPLAEEGVGRNKSQDEIHLWVQGTNSDQLSQPKTGTAAAEDGVGVGVDSVTGQTGAWGDFDQFMTDAIVGIGDGSTPANGEYGAQYNFQTSDPSNGAENDGASALANGEHGAQYEFETSYPFGSVENFEYDAKETAENFGFDAMGLAQYNEPPTAAGTRLGGAGTPDAELAVPGTGDVDETSFTPYSAAQHGLGPCLDMQADSGDLPMEPAQDMGIDASIMKTVGHNQTAATEAGDLSVTLTQGAETHVETNSHANPSKTQDPHDTQAAAMDVDGMDTDPGIVHEKRQAEDEPDDVHPPSPKRARFDHETSVGASDGLAEGQYAVESGAEGGVPRFIADAADVAAQLSAELMGQFEQVGTEVQTT